MIVSNYEVKVMSIAPCIDDVASIIVTSPLCKVSAVRKIIIVKTCLLPETFFCLFVVVAANSESGLTCPSLSGPIF